LFSFTEQYEFDIVAALDQLVIGSPDHLEVLAKVET
jgi:hypothetical protein